jgi:hypothetical protein
MAHIAMQRDCRGKRRRADLDALLAANMARDPVAGISDRSGDETGTNRLCGESPGIVVRKQELGERGAHDAATSLTQGSQDAGAGVPRRELRTTRSTKPARISSSR